MAARRELGLPRPSTCNLKEQLVRTTFRNVRSQGHTYVELRQDGKSLIFYCTLCLAPCYSDSVLFDHLKGSLHSERLATAKSTLMKPNPFPFNDGRVFFHDSPEQEKESANSDARRAILLDTNEEIENDLAIVSYGENLGANPDGHMSANIVGSKNSDSAMVDTDSDNSPCASDLNGGNDCSLVITGVLHKDEIADLELKFIGFGQIAARFIKKDGISNDFQRIWCEWLGKNDSSNQDFLMVPVHDFAVVTFSYNYSLGRKGLLDDMHHLLSSSPCSEREDNPGSKDKKRRSFSDPEDISESLSNQYDSSGEESQSSNNLNSMLLLSGYDDQLLHSRVLTSKKIRRQLRRERGIATERMCDICQIKMHPGKDVAALLNRNTGKLVCSSRNLTGAFHIFHVSCLIHWILQRELETYAQPLDTTKVKSRSRRKGGSKCNTRGKRSKIKCVPAQTYSVFCPECQGTGINISGNELEAPPFSLSEIYNSKISLSDARRAWVKSPEVLQNCSTGFCLPSQSEDVSQGIVTPMKLLYFYRVAE